MKDVAKAMLWGLSALIALAYIAITVIQMSLAITYNCWLTTEKINKIISKVKPIVNSLAQRLPGEENVAGYQKGRVMAKYIVTSPEGEKYEVTAPNDASEQQVMEYAQKNFGKQAGGQPGAQNMAMTLDQQKAVAIANADRRAAEADGQPDAPKRPLSESEEFEFRARLENEAKAGGVVPAHDLPADLVVPAHDLPTGDAPKRPWNDTIKAKNEISQVTREVCVGIQYNDYKYDDLYSPEDNLKTLNSYISDPSKIAVYNLYICMRFISGLIGFIVGIIFVYRLFKTGRFGMKSNIFYLLATAPVFIVAASVSLIYSDLDLSPNNTDPAAIGLLISVLWVFLVYPAIYILAKKQGGLRAILHP